MFCAKCGAVLSDHARKCDKCGAPVRIRPSQSGKQDNRYVLSQPDESDMPLQKDIENSLQEESFMDPVFFEEAGGNVDVDAIIKIARGEDSDDVSAPAEDKKSAAEKPAEKKAAASEEAPAKKPAEKKSDRSEKSAVKKADAKKSDTFEKASAKKADAKKSALKVPEIEIEEPETETIEIEEPELNMDTYLESLPLIEKIRRKIQAYHHEKEEAADEKRMKKQLEKAVKHFREEEGYQPEAETFVKAPAKQAQKAAVTSAAAKAKAESAAQAPAKQARKAVVVPESAKDKAESAAQAPAQQEQQEEKAAAVSAAGKARTEAAAKEEADRAEVIRLQQEQAHSERVAAAARLKERARAGAARRQSSLQPEENDRPQEREGLEVIRLQDRDHAAQAARRQEDETAAEEALRQEAELAAQAARQQEEQERAARAKEDVKRAQAARQQDEQSSIQKFLNSGTPESASYTLLNEHNHKELTEEERRIEALRRQRKYLNSQPDRFDEYLGKYGLTKEMAVRIATLFLIAVLSVIYVMGRGGSNTAPDLSNAGEGATGVESAQEQPVDGTVTEPSQDGADTQVPTGGGDFENN